MVFRTTPAAVSIESTRQKGPDCFRCTSGAKDFPSIRRARRYELVTPLEPLRIHDLRHTAASLAVDSGANVKGVQEMLGHASAAMTLDRYAGLFTGHLEEVADRMDAVLTQDEWHESGTNKGSVDRFNQAG